MRVMLVLAFIAHLLAAGTAIYGTFLEKGGSYYRYQGVKKEMTRARQDLNRAELLSRTKRAIETGEVPNGQSVRDEDARAIVLKMDELSFQMERFVKQRSGLRKKSAIALIITFTAPVWFLLYRRVAKNEPGTT